MFAIDLDVLRNLLVTYGLRVVAAALVLLLGLWVARRLSRLLGAMMERYGVDVTLTKFLGNVIYYALLAAVLVAAAGQLGIDTTSFLAVLGAAGLAVGLALKDSLANFSAGVMLILFRPFRVGDVVTAAGETGVVMEISIFNTILNTGDNQRKIIPNGNILNDTITNINAYPTRRIDLVFSIGYQDNLQEAQQLVRQVLAAEQRVLRDPEPTVAVGELAASSVDLLVRPWVKSADYWDVRFALLERVKAAFDQAGISIPFPQQDVHLYRCTSEDKQRAN
ncbi:mechanosensitive ion channel family protein [Desulfofustis limnaeus]|jgi:small conductance mechanosensitive channel|uniref:Mechanosensitive ion channel protein n=1 Tax=Desulfofustis limnaeus TaxID=2740163 RepID=A0ABN6M7Y9_9BACT|nr:mechanosensitive ion channel domain-containing protein [Desulfofustis limnaeus]MDX9894083.1 mechanosensitive ion channel [Desulfofustis sp.]BDD88984.1 mechanosensitive ion channel protein [Desulfofustis limnaeus]